MELKGKIEVIGDVQNVSDTFWKREFVIDYRKDNSQYNDLIKFELVKDKCDIIETFKVGDEVKVIFDISGRKWTNPKGEEVYFNSLKAWKLERAGQEAPAAVAGSSAAPAPKDEPDWLKEGSSDSAADDEMPF